MLTQHIGFVCVSPRQGNGKRHQSYIVYSSRSSICIRFQAMIYLNMVSPREKIHGFYEGFRQTVVLKGLGRSEYVKKQYVCVYLKYPKKCRSSLEFCDHPSPRRIWGRFWPGASHRWRWPPTGGVRRFLGSCKTEDRKEPRMPHVDM